jgi:RNA polymerase sigma-70 factor
VAAPAIESGGVDEHLARRLYAQSGAAAWNVSPGRYREALSRSLVHRFGTDVPGDGGREYLESRAAADLALACACIDGHDAAWEHFVRELRPQLYHAARTIAADEGRELADSLYAELFGLPGADGARRSLLAHYHGRSRLITWLRSVLVQRRIDRIRVARRFEPLDENAEAPLSPASEERDPDRDTLVAHAQQALDAAIDALAPADRLRLRLYYGQDMTLAAIGRVLDEHEATVSRKLEKARRALKAGVDRALADRGLGGEARARALQMAADAPELQLDRLLSRAEDG